MLFLELKHAIQLPEPVPPGVARAAAAGATLYSCPRIGARVPPSPGTPDLAIAPAPLQAAIHSPSPLRPHPLDSDVSGGCCYTPLGGPYRRHYFSPDNPVTNG